MATTTIKKRPSKLKAGKKKKINMWLILSGIAAVAIVGVIVVRYSGASGESWSVRSSAMTLRGGKIVEKSGTTYWLGTKNGEGVTFTAPAAGNYCITGQYLTTNMIASSSYGDGTGHGAGGSGSVGSQKDYLYCHSLSKGYTLNQFIGSSGSMTVTKVVKQ